MPKVVDSDQRRQLLAEATSRLICRGGLAAATMRDIAAEAGLTTGSVTHYFADKRELLVFTLEESLRHRRGRRQDAVAAGPRAALRATLEGALPIDAERHRHWMVTIAFCASAAGDAELAAVQRVAYREFRSNIVTQLRACGLTAANARSVAERLIAVADGIAMQAIFDPASWPNKRQVALLAEALHELDGMLIDSSVANAAVSRRSPSAAR
jgi:AcrR family transcriptional regulator